MICPIPQTKTAVSDIAQMSRQVKMECVHHLASSQNIACCHSRLPHRSLLKEVMEPGHWEHSQVDALQEHTCGNPEDGNGPTMGASYCHICYGLCQNGYGLSPSECRNEFLILFSGLAARAHLRGHLEANLTRKQTSR